MRHKRTLSNNAVIAIDDAGNEIVALGRGIGHGRRPGDELDAARVEQIFVAGGDAARNQLASFLADVPLDVVRVAARIAHLAHERLGLAVTQGLILPLADHLAFAVRRKAEGSASNCRWRGRWPSSTPRNWPWVGTPWLWPAASFTSSWTRRRQPRSRCTS